MSIAATGEIIHLPFGERPAYGSPYPEGIAVGHIDQVGDASGNPITATFLADGGFLYRLELTQATRGGVDTTDWDYITSHRWATDKSGLGATAFDLNWVAAQQSQGLSSFTSHTPRVQDLAAIRRFPMGRTDKVALQTLLSWTAENTDTILYDFDVVLTYWRKESLSMPGFLSAFYEAPAAPTLLRPLS